MTTYPAFFTTRVNAEIGLEGGYSNDSDDSGGETMWGITKVDAIENGYTGAMRDMPRATAVDIYWRKYFVRTQLDKLALIDAPIAAKLFDIAINAGVGKMTFLQRALNVLNYVDDQHVLFEALDVDGDLGGMTRAALTAFIGRRGADGRKVLLGMIIALQSVFYIECVENNRKDAKFAWGWELARAVGTGFATT